MPTRVTIRAAIAAESPKSFFPTVGLDFFIRRLPDVVYLKSLLERILLKDIKISWIDIGRSVGDEFALEEVAEAAADGVRGVRIGHKRIQFLADVRAGVPLLGNGDGA